MHRRALFAAFLFFGACKNRDVIRAQRDGDAPRMATMLAMADKRAPSQLVEGWYNLEDNSWRWTAGRFSVLLRPPLNADRNGAILKLSFNLPTPVIDEVKSTTLTASVNGTELAPQTYTRPGNFTYTCDVPAKLLAEDSVKVVFALDKFLPPGAKDNRQLGLAVTSVGFEGGGPNQ